MATKSKTSAAAAEQDNATLKLVGVAALGLAAGLAANFGRKLMVQAPTMAAGSWREALALEHKMVLKLFDAIEATDDSQTAKRTMLLTQIKHALGKHAFQEENVVYPAIRDAGSREAAEKLIVEHGDVKHHLFELEVMPQDDPNFLPTIRSLRADLEAHMREEEDEIFPAFDQALSEEKRKQLTLSMNKEGLKLA